MEDGGGGAGGKEEQGEEEQESREFNGSLCIGLMCPYLSMAGDAADGGAHALPHYRVGSLMMMIP